jgi:hypothetical protein
MALTRSHHAAAGAQDGDAHARAHAVDSIVTDVNAAAGRGHATNAVDRRLTLAAVAKHQGEHLGLVGYVALAGPYVVEVTLGLHDGSHVLLELGVRHLAAVVPRERGVPDAREHVRNGVGHHGITSSP